MEHPILMNAFSVRAILDGRKTQTRRVIKPQPAGDVTDARIWVDGLWRIEHKPTPVPGGRYVGVRTRCPYGRPGDRLWVRETWRVHPNSWCCYQDGYIEIQYRADEGKARHRIRRPDAAKLTEKYADGRWRPSIFMFRWASRIALEVTGVRVGRVQQIGEEEAIAEGVPRGAVRWIGDARMHFAALWDRINADRGFSWESNPWVWVVEFRRINASGD
jgi:hypothetical protein